MAGYTPVFDSIYDGSLHGRWPAAAVWASLLPLCNRDGEIRLTMEAIAARTGWPLKLLKKGIEELMQPDPDSQSDELEGRRLVLIDDRKRWGWRAVNHTKYRDKARKKQHSEREQEEGKNAERMKDRRSNNQAHSSKTGRDRTRPDETRRDPPSDADAEADSNTESERTAPRRATRLPDDFVLTSDRKLVAEAERLPAERTFEKFRDYWRGVGGAKARKLDWDATWRNWCRSEADRIGAPRGPQAPSQAKRFPS